MRTRAIDDVSIDRFRFGRRSSSPFSPGLKNIGKLTEAVSARPPQSSKTESSRNRAESDATADENALMLLFFFTSFGRTI